MLVEKREEYANALEQLHDLILQMEQHKTTLSQKETVLTAELADKNGKLDRMTTRINELKQSIAEQEFSVQDIYKMEGELKGLSEACDRAYMLREQHRKIILSVEEELASVCNDLDETCADYNGRIAELQLVPELGSKFYGFKAEIDSSQLLNGNPSDIIGFDLELVNRNVASAKSEYLEKTDKSKLEYQNILIELQQVSDAYDESLAKLKIVNDKKLKSDQILEDEIQMSQSQLAVRNREVDAMEAKIHVLQNPVALEEQMAGFQRQCAELEALRIERQESYAMELRAMVDEVNSACELMSEHDTYLRQQVAKVDAHWQTTLNQVDDVVLPANMSIGGSV